MTDTKTSECNLEWVNKCIIITKFMYLYQMKYTGVLIKCTKIVLELSNEYKTFLIVRDKKNILLHLFHCRRKLPCALLSV